MKSFTPTEQISNQAARRFLLAHHFLLPPKQIPSDQIVDQIFGRLGCIQFDTINVVGRNADRVLQSRVKGYTQSILDDLLYQQRDLIDGWDKVASIFPKEDWPYFIRHRERMSAYHQARSEEAMAAAPNVLKLIEEQGPLSSIDVKDETKTDWFWAPTSVTRAAMEILFAQGKLGIHHRVNTHRHFDLIERLLPAEILAQPKPFEGAQDYLEWHLLRRIGSMGLVSLGNGGGEHWGGIQDGGRYAKPRKEAIDRLRQKGLLDSVVIEDTSGKEYLFRQKDRECLENAASLIPSSNTVTFIAPLDNLMWNRSMIEDIFGFSYTWEVYTPKEKREYGYYVLPVLYKDQLIARTDLKFDSKTSTLKLLGWWWENGIQLDDQIVTAVQNGLEDFIAYLGAGSLSLENGNLSNKSDRQIFDQIARKLG